MRPPSPTDPDEVRVFAAERQWCATRRVWFRYRAGRVVEGGACRMCRETIEREFKGNNPAASR